MVVCGIVLRAPADGRDMLIVNGGYPRSGTVLVGAIVCEILRLRGREWERYNPQERSDLNEFENKVRTWPRDGAVLLVHTHLANADVMRALAERDDAVVFWNHRDPRDVFVSLRKLHDLPLNRALAAVQVYGRVEQLAAQFRFVQRLRYEDFIKNPPALVAHIAQKLGWELDAEQIAQIAEATSVQEHRKIMEDVAEETLPGVRVLPTQTRPLREDPETLINDRHIQSGAPGRWRQELSDEERASVIELLKPFVDALRY